MTTTITIPSLGVPVAAGPIRYMGTKRALASIVREEALRIGAQGLVADLFSGMGTVSAALAPDRSILVNDALSFTGALARARFLERSTTTSEAMSRLLFPAYRACQDALRERFRDRLAEERAALEAGPSQLRAWIKRAPHVGNSDSARVSAHESSTQVGPERYALTTLYFAAGYFSTAQAIGLDSLRFAIDQQQGLDRDWLLAVWITCAGRLVNAPGHAAQFLQPTSEEAFKRVRRQWQRSPWATFGDSFSAVSLVGDRRWRRGNLVVTGDAAEVVRSTAFDQVGLVYADPPYTKDHYSRYYHVYETLYRYDYPDSLGQGRYRSDRLSSRFSILSKTTTAFEDLFSAVSARGLPMILSYPENGLATQRVDMAALVKRYFSLEHVLEFTLRHSTLGRSTGTTTKEARERIYVCRP